MRKIFVLIVILATSLSVDSQTCKGDYSVSVNGNYYKGSNSSGVSTNSFTSNGENLNANISIEHYRTSKSYVGLGIDFHWGNNDISNSLFSKKFSQFENMNVKSIFIFPNFIYGYYWQIADNLFLNMSTRIGLGVLSNNYNSDYKNFQHPYGGTLDQIETASEELRWDNSNTYLDFGLLFSPEINYFISDNFGLSLRLGGIDYYILDWKKDFSTWNVNFNANNWRLGIRYII